MRFWLAAAVALAIVGCGKDEPAKINIDLNKDAAGSDTKRIKSDPTGKNQCIKCNLKTNDDKCPKCGTVLKAANKPSSAPQPAKSGATVGKSTTSAVYACPECPFTDPRGGTCIKHTEIKLKLQYFVCAKCSVKEAVAGKCSKCGTELKKTLE